MNRVDHRWALQYSLLLAALTSVPYLLAARAQGSDWVFTGFLLGVEDGNSYLAKMLAGHAGDWLFKTPYSTVEQRGVLAFLPYLLLGKLVGPSHAARAVAFHGLRVLALPILVWAVYGFVSRFASTPEWRRWVTVLGTLGGGLGWLLVLLGRPDWLGTLPLEFYSPETFGFLAAYSFPHLALGRAALLASLGAYLGRASGWVPGGLLLLAGLIHPPILLTGLAVLSAHLLAVLVSRGGAKARSGALGRFGRAVGPSLPLLAYFALAVGRDPFLQRWAEQNIVRSPHPLHYLLAFAAVLPLALGGARRLLSHRDWRSLLLPSWGLALPLLAYAPVNLQRRLPEAGWIALLTLAAVGGESLARQFHARLRIGLTVILLPSSLMILVGGLWAGLPPGLPGFRPAEETAAFEWLARNARRGEVVLASYETGNALPAWAALRVVIGHGPETAGLAELEPQVVAFYGAQARQSERLALLRDQQVSFLIHGPAEHSLGSWDPATWDCLRRVFQTGDFSVYATCVRPER